MALWELAKLVVPDQVVAIGGTRVLPAPTTPRCPTSAQCSASWAVRRWPARPTRTVGAAVAAGALFTLLLALGGLVLFGLLGVELRR